MIFCAAGDPGGSRAVLPVVLELEKQGIPCRIVQHGFLGRELPVGLHGLFLSPEQAMRNLPQCRAFLFGSSAVDPLPLSLARAAKQRGIPVVHVLDNWSSYRSRLETDGKEMLKPDIYAVIDEEAWRAAEAEGIPASSLRVTGHPDFMTVPPVADLRRNAGLLQELGLPADKRIIAFINEPFEKTCGSDPESPGHPGFLETEVFRAWLGALESFSDSIYGLFLPHPREADDFGQPPRNCFTGPVRGKTVFLPFGRDILRIVHGVAGMASILLYEAWLIGLPVLSLQPGCKLESMRRFSGLEHRHYASTRDDIPAVTAGWMAACLENKPPVSRPEWLLHKNAATTLVQLLRTLMER